MATTATPQSEFCVRQMTLTTFRRSSNCNFAPFPACRLGQPDSWSATWRSFPKASLWLPTRRAAFSARPAR